MPFTLWNTTLIGDNLEKLAPEREARDCRNMSELRNIEWENVTEVKDI
jgi:hypothetical protein